MLAGITDLKIPHANSAVADHLTLSIGVATASPQEGSRPAELIEAADKMLYRAKDQGRNRIETARLASKLRSVGP